MEYKITVLKDAISEAKRFVVLANEAIKHLESDEYARFSSRKNASAKRASMDLSNALIKVRRPEK